MKIREALRKGMNILKSNNIDSPNLKSRLLLQFVMKKTRQYIIVYDNEELSKKEQFEFFVNIEKLTSGIPLQHITHSQEFMKMDFYINENVLVPRPDTEILVEEVINIANRIKKPQILDLCTGSGAIAISISKNVVDSKIIATDISSKALDVAKINSNRFKTEKNIEFIKSDLFKNLKDMKFDIIVSNPPYIKRDDIKSLEKEVKNEPIIALDGGEDGLKFYKEILNNCIEYSKIGTYICLEIGYNQKEEVLNLINQKKYFIETYCKKDLCGNDRVIVTRLGG